MILGEFNFKEIYTSHWEKDEETMRILYFFWIHNNVTLIKNTI